MFIIYILIIIHLSIVIESTRTLKIISLLNVLSLVIYSTFIIFQYITYNKFDENLLFDIDFQMLFPLINIEFLDLAFKLAFYIDGISLFLIYLTLILYFVCLLTIWDVMEYFKLLNLLLFIIIICIIVCFSTYSLLLFYIFFEMILLPVTLVIALFGSRDRRLLAINRLFFYTLIGSMCFLVVLVYLLINYGTTNLLKLVLFFKFDNIEQQFLWFLLFIGFGFKVPLYPLHTWLPEAHAEAPTVGSMLLAGILLKLGPYGLLRFANMLFPLGSIYFQPLIVLSCSLGLYYTSLAALRQIDLKRIVAYSSISHMALIVISLVTHGPEGLFGGVVLLIAHGFVSAGSFFISGCLYERYKTRLLLYYGGLFRLNPKLVIIMFLFLLGNISFPGTLNFMAELLILTSLVEYSFYIVVLFSLSSVFILSYNLFMFSRVFYGEEPKNYIYNFDINSRELVVGFILLSPVFLWGVFGSFMSDLLNFGIDFQFILFNFKINILDETIISVNNL